MTREEAIECLSERVLIGKTCEQSCMVGFGVNIDTLDEAIDMAISALRQQEHFREVTKKVEPLTLDELRQMDGEPVWIHFIGGAVIRNDGWFIVSQIGTSEIFLSGKVSVYKNFWYYGETWLAYSQKPEEDDHG